MKDTPVDYVTGSTVGRWFFFRVFFECEFSCCVPPQCSYNNDGHGWQTTFRRFNKRCKWKRARTLCFGCCFFETEHYGSMIMLEKIMICVRFKVYWGISWSYGKRAEYIHIFECEAKDGVEEFSNIIIHVVK